MRSVNAERFSTSNLARLYSTSHLPVTFKLHPSHDPVLEDQNFGLQCEHHKNMRILICAPPEI